MPDSMKGRTAMPPMANTRNGTAAAFVDRDGGSGARLEDLLAKVRHRIGIIAATALAAVATGCAGVAPPPATSLRIIAFNDFHGHIERAASLAGAIRELRRGHANVAVVAAGDLVGASPPGVVALA